MQKPEEIQGGSKQSQSNIRPRLRKENGQPRPGVIHILVDTRQSSAMTFRPEDGPGSESISAVQGAPKLARRERFTSSVHEAGSRQLEERRKVGGLLGYGVVRRGEKAGVLHRKDDRRRRRRSCRGHRSDEVVGRPWHRKDRQGSARAVGHTHQAPCGHEAANDHILLHVYHRTRAVGCGVGSHPGEGCNHEEDRGDRSNHHTVRVGSHRRGGPWASEIGTYRGPCHQDHQGLRKEPSA